MENQPQINPVYSYAKFKELADERMSQVKVYIQSGDNWESAGSGMIEFFQIENSRHMKEIKALEDFKRDNNNYYLAIESSNSNELTQEELKNLSAFRSVLKTKEVSSANVIAFYDLFGGHNFDFDIESKISRKSYQLGS